MDKTINRTFKKPDLHAPRCRKPVYQLIAPITNKVPGKEYTHEFVKKFKKEYPQYKDMANNDALKILNLFHEKLWKHALHNRDGIELPKNLGYIFLGTCASAKKYNVDFGTMIKDNIKVRHKNFESDNKLAKIFYTNYFLKYRFRNREMWSFTATRDFKRAVPEVYRNNWKTYVEVESGRSISKYMKRAKKKAYFKNREETYEVDSSYNEFDLN
jgi:hypothetical protein